MKHIDPDRTPNDAVDADGEKRRSFVAPLFTAGYGERYAAHPGAPRPSAPRWPEHMQMHFARIGLAAILALSLPISACVVYPEVTQYYDADCKIVARQLELRAGDLANADCGGGGAFAGACWAALLGVGAASAIVSGSIVVVGNTVFWLEKKGKCLAKPQA